MTHFEKKTASYALQMMSKAAVLSGTQGRTCQARNILTDKRTVARRDSRNTYQVITHILSGELYVVLSLPRVEAFKRQLLRCTFFCLTFFLKQFFHALKIIRPIGLMRVEFILLQFKGALFCIWLMASYSKHFTERRHTNVMLHLQLPWYTCKRPSETGA